MIEIACFTYFFHSFKIIQFIDISEISFFNEWNKSIETLKFKYVWNVSKTSLVVKVLAPWVQIC